MMAIKFFCVFMFYISMALPAAWGSNLQLGNLDEVSVNTAAGTMTFSLNLTQDNSWYGTYNNDAVWVFM